MGRHHLSSHITSSYFEALGALRAESPIIVYVEGYEDVLFWRSIFDNFETQHRHFEIMTPSRADMAKGKKVVLNFADNAGKALILCVDSDFDYLIDEATYQSKIVNTNPYVIQTYVYAIENLLCLPSSLGSIAARITKNDTRIFDFEDFFNLYSTAIYPAFVWYFFAAKIDRPHIFTLSDFRNIVKINYLDVSDGGESTIAYIERSVKRKVEALRRKYPDLAPQISQTEQLLACKGVKDSQTHLYMQGHTLQDNVVKILLTAVCNALRGVMISRIESSRQQPLTRRNEMNAYNNALRDIDTVVADNTIYQHTPHYDKIRSRIETILGN